MAFSIGKFVPLILENDPEHRLTAREIAQKIMERWPNDCEEKRLRSQATKTVLDSDAALLQQIVAEIGAQRPSLERKGIRTTEGRPRRYFFSTKSNEDEIKSVESDGIDAMAATTVPQNAQLSEHDLYPMLSEYLYSELGVLSKRIDERRASNLRGRGGNRWLYPDLVGMQDLSASWHPEIKACSKEYFDKKTKLWSFEVKIKINLSNVREAYFQAVSNSSWANFGYLVCAEIQGKDTLDELRMLSGRHGIGLIKLETDNISESQILIPCAERADVDWSTMDRVAHENPDFVQYINLVRQFYQTDDPRPADWDFSQQR